jgi:hypothetical protein
MYNFQNMETKIFTLYLFILICFSTNRNLNFQNKGIGEDKRNYPLLIKNVFLKISEKKDASNVELQKIIPRTEEEFIEYISYSSEDRPKEFRRVFGEIDSIIAMNAKKNLDDFFKLFLEMAPFVDGMYAETYFEKVDMVIEKNMILFCHIYNSLNQESKKRLGDYSKQYCR